VFTRDDLPKIAKTLKHWLSEGAPVSPRDAMAERIRFAQTEAELAALLPDIAKLSDADKTDLRAVYAARKAEFQGVPQ
jgi:hypothetical protein